MSGIDWDKEFSLMNPQTPPTSPVSPTTEKPGKPATSRFSAAVGGMRRNSAALAVCGTIAVVAVCGTVIAVTNVQADQVAQERARAQEAAANALVEAEADKQRAQTEEATAKAVYEREMTVYRECMKLRAAAVAKAASYDIARIPECDAPVFSGTAARAQKSSGDGAGGGITSSPWLWVALVGGGGFIAYKKLSAPSGSGAVTPVNGNKGFTFEKGA
ncbi:hypothetical protein OG909_32785 (plasmid) [Streptomyces sp. NBC_01754]|uniref:hypothetical protein n=1 Tax=Streptomyces sp. NBC_01754 TaxID=2975930 RepID=UPI002DD94FFE|nr:hypothetical protein [Streptomyces sp. NBC_01754]WSC97083.1 hypothetical protein OG909_32785 [Streptomyces sp. NBC_01754]